MKRMGALLLAMTLLASVGATAGRADHCVGTDAGAAYIGVGGKIYIVGRESAVSEEKVTDILCAKGDDAYCISEGALARVSLKTGALVKVRAKVTQAAYIASEDAIYFLADGALNRLSPDTGKTTDIATDGLGANPVLFATMQGLVVATDAGAARYVPSANGFAEETFVSDARYFSAGTFETRLENGGALSMRPANESEWKKIADGVTAHVCGEGVAYYAVNGALYSFDAQGVPQKIADVAGDVASAMALNGENALLVADGKLVSVNTKTGARETLDATVPAAPVLYAENGAIVIADADSGEAEAVTAPAQAKQGEATALSVGSSGEEVRKMQSRLKELGYLSGGTDGSFGRATKIAVRKFQDAMGVRQSGTADEALLAKLYASDAPKYVRYRALRPGSSGIRVEEMQNRLLELKYLSKKSEVDGSFGDKTETAVRLFQGDMGEKETGKITAKQLKRLFTTKKKYVKCVELTRGNTGERVKIMQRRLKKLGYFHGSIGGHFRAKTEEAVELFQTAIGVTADGVATVETLKALYAKHAPQYGKKPKPTTAPDKPIPTAVPDDGDEPAQDDDTASSYKELKPGDSGKAVKRLKARLNKLGYLPDAEYDAASDAFDTATMKAVKRAQKAFLMGQTGIATVKFQERLFK